MHFGVVSNEAGPGFQFNLYPAHPVFFNCLLSQIGSISAANMIRDTVATRSAVSRRMKKLPGQVVSQGKMPCLMIHVCWGWVESRMQVVYLPTF